MRPRTFPILLLTMALLTGCAAGRTNKPADSPAPPPAAPSATTPTTTDPGGGFPVKPAPPGAMQRVSFDSTLAIPGPGLYIVDLSTGKVESWQRSDGQRLFRLSEDRRWAVMPASGQEFWANRQSGKIVGWNPHEVELLAAGPGAFLFAAAGSGPRNFYVTDGEFELKNTFQVDVVQGSNIEARFAPDGKRVVLNTGRRSPDGKFESQVFLVDVATGSSRPLGAPPTPTTGMLVGAELLDPTGGEVVLSYVVQVGEPTGLAREQSIIRRYSWQGELVGETPLAGRAWRLSPDGRLIVSGGNVDHLTDAVVVTDLATGQPRFRVLGATAMQWTADGSRLVLSGRNGSEYLFSTAGELKQAPAVPRGEQLVFDQHLVAAPDDPHRFLSGLTVLDDTGKVIQSVQVPKGNNWLVRNGDWGVSANEYVLRISEPTGKGNIGFDFPLPPAVQKPPFPSPYILAVRDPKGDCLNLRDAYSRTGRVIRCLPTGTKLAVADLAKAPEKTGAWSYGDDQIWFWVRTEQGETGWVSASAGSVVWVQ